MRFFLGFSALVMATLAVAASSDKVEVSEPVVKQSVVTEAGVAEDLARSRARRLANIEYRLHFDIPEDERDPIAASVSIDFERRM